MFYKEFKGGKYWTDWYNPDVAIFCILSNFKSPGIIFFRRLTCSIPFSYSMPKSILNNIKQSWLIWFYIYTKTNMAGFEWIWFIITCFYLIFMPVFSQSITACHYRNCIYSWAQNYRSSSINFKSFFSLTRKNMNLPYSICTYVWKKFLTADR